MIWLLFPLLSTGATPEAAAHPSQQAPTVCTSVSTEGAWQVVGTRNFAVHCQGPSAPIQESAAQWEPLREQLQRKWLGTAGAPWSPRCQVVLHSKRADYARAAGAGAENSNGSSLIELRGSQIVTRRIDLCCESLKLGLAALPHELTHVVLADRFRTTAPPPWADEGMAIQADPAAKRELHQRDLEKALADGRAFDSRRLLATTCCPLGDMRATFYGQSASLVTYLVELGSPHQFVQFLEIAGRAGYDRALAETYGIQSVERLNRMWTAHIESPSRKVLLAGQTAPTSEVSKGDRPPGVRFLPTGGTPLDTR